MVAFASAATNLDPRDTDSIVDYYVHDRVTRTTTLVSERLGTGPSLQGGYGVSISADGRYVAFDCLDDNVLPGDTNGKSDVFVRDLVTQTTELVSVGPAGQQGDSDSHDPCVSGDGRFVAFISGARNWFTHTYNYGSGVFVRDRRLGVTLPVTMLPNGKLAPGVTFNPSISADGRYVAFSGDSAVLVPGEPYQYPTVLRWDRLTGATINVCASTTGGEPSYPSERPALSADGRFVAFETWAVNLAVQSGKTPMVIWTDIETGTTVVVNEAPDGSSANDWANRAAISGDGRAVAFVSKATNLLPPDTGWIYHVYVRACDVASPSTYCKPANPPGGCAARMTFQGTPSASAGSGLDVRAEGVDAGKVGLLFYGKGGPWGQAVSQGFLCVQGPIVRAQVAGSCGTAGCDGVLAMDFNAWIASGADPALVAGQSAYVQAWFRSGPGTSQLSDALALLIEP